MDSTTAEVKVPSSKVSFALAETPLPQTVYQSYWNGVWTALLWTTLFFFFLYLIQVFRTRAGPPLVATPPATLLAQQTTIESSNPIASQIRARSVLPTEEPSEEPGTHST